MEAISIAACHSVDYAYTKSRLQSIGFVMNHESQRSRLLECKKLLLKLDTTKKENWATVMNVALRVLTFQEVQHELGISQATLNEWKRKKDGAAPRKGTRRLVKRALIELIDEKISEGKIC